MADKRVRVREIPPVVSRCMAEGGIPYVLSQGMIFPANHPLVEEQEWAFEPVVEDASAAPGTKRATRRKKSAVATDDE